MAQKKIRQFHMPFLFIYLFIQTYLYRVKILLAFGYFAYVPCFMTSICIKSETKRYIYNIYIYNDICLCVNCNFCILHKYFCAAEPQTVIQ